MWVWILAIFYFFIPFVAEAKLKFPTPSRTECRFYPELEAELKCEPNIPNYLSGYGAKYCHEFQTRKTVWTIRLMNWTDETTYCLQKTLTYDESLLSPCSNIAEYAFESHPRCYKSAGFCNLDDDDKKTIVKVVSFADIKSTLGSSVLQGLSIGLKCNLGISRSTMLVLSYLWQLAKNQIDEFKNQVLALIEFIFSDSKNVELNSKKVLAEIIGIDANKSKGTKAYAELNDVSSFTELSNRCATAASKSPNLCAQMAEAQGDDWYSRSADLQMQSAREGVKRAFMKYGQKSQAK